MIGRGCAASRPPLLSAPSARARFPGNHVILPKVKVLPAAARAAGDRTQRSPPSPTAVPVGAPAVARATPGGAGCGAPRSPFPLPIVSKNSADVHLALRRRGTQTLVGNRQDQPLAKSPMTSGCSPRALVAPKVLVQDGCILKLNNAGLQQAKGRQV